MPDAGPLHRLRAGRPGVAERYANVELNLRRSALQVMGCGDGVIAHLPLPAQFTMVPVETE
jgi:hypothetical protein